MKQLYFLDEEEKNRILNLHESATKRQYLSEQQTGAKFIYNNPNDKAYDYKMENGKYYFKGKPNTSYATKYPNWYEAKADRGIKAIKALFDAGTNVTTTEVKQNTNTDPSKAAQETAKVAQTGVAPAAGTPAGTNTASGTPAGTTTAGTTTAGTTPAGTSGVVTLKVTDAIVAPQAGAASTTTSTKSATDTAETNMSSSNPVVASNAPDEDNSINQNATSR
jgi:hypothetical protein